MGITFKEARNSFVGLGEYLLKSKFRIQDKQTLHPRQTSPIFQERIKLDTFLFSIEKK